MDWRARIVANPDVLVGKPVIKGIAIGGRPVRARPNARGQVRVSRLTWGYWADRAIGARRLVTTPSDTQ